MKVRIYGCNLTFMFIIDLMLGKLRASIYVVPLVEEAAPPPQASSNKLLLVASVIATAVFFCEMAGERSERSGNCSATSCIVCIMCPA